MTSTPYSVESIRRGASYYVGGRVVSAILTVTIQLLLVRILNIGEYGIYVTLVAGVELATGLATCGLNLAIARYLPEYRLLASAAQTRKFVWRLVGYRALALSIAAVAWWLGATSILKWSEVELPSAGISILGLLIITEGVGVFLRDNVLGALIEQRRGRVCQLARQMCWLTLLGVTSLFDGSLLIAALWAELAGAVVGLGLGLSSLRTVLGSAAAKGAARQGWQEPSRLDVIQTCGRVYAADLVSQASSTAVFLLLIQRFAGNEAAGTFGFLRVIYAQLSHYLPATLLFNVIQPKLTAAFIDGGGIQALSRNANLAGKVSIFMLMPIISFIAAGGDILIEILSDGRFPNTGGLFFVMILSMIAGSQGQLAYTVAVICGRSGLCTAASFVSLIALPLSLLLLLLDFGAWAGAISMLISNSLVVGFLVAALSFKTEYKPDLLALAKFLLSAVIAWGCAELLPNNIDNAIKLVLMATVSIIIYTLSVIVLAPFSSSELVTLNRVIGRNFFTIRSSR